MCGYGFHAGSVQHSTCCTPSPRLIWQPSQVSSSSSSPNDKSFEFLTAFTSLFLSFLSFLSLLPLSWSFFSSLLLPTPSLFVSSETVSSFFLGFLNLILPWSSVGGPLITPSSSLVRTSASA